MATHNPRPPRPATQLQPPAQPAPPPRPPQQPPPASTWRYWVGGMILSLAALAIMVALVSGDGTSPSPTATVAAAAPQPRTSEPARLELGCARTASENVLGIRLAGWGDITISPAPIGDDGNPTECWTARVYNTPGDSTTSVTSSVQVIRGYSDGSTEEYTEGPGGVGPKARGSVLWLKYKLGTESVVVSFR